VEALTEEADGRKSTVSSLAAIKIASVVQAEYAGALASGRLPPLLALEVPQPRNFGIVTALADYDSTLDKIAAIAVATVPTALVAWFASTRILCV
jgi:hypothetical protein